MQEGSLKVSKTIQVDAAEFNSSILVRDSRQAPDPSADLNSFGENYGDKNLIVRSFTKELYNSPCWPVLSVYCAFKGREYFQTKKCTYAVTNSNYLVLNEGTQRSGFISAENDVESFSVNFSPFFLKGYLSSIAHSGNKIMEDSFRQDADGLQFTEQLYEHDLLVSPELFKIRYLLDNCEVNLTRIEEAVMHLLEAMILNQGKIWNRIRKVDCAKPSTQRELYERLTRTKDYMSSCFKDDITIEDLSRLACLNQHYFLREFKKMFGVTPHGYIQDLRLKEARRMLRTTCKRTIEICHEVGYNDPSSFCKLFRKEFHCSPMDYRFANLSSASFSVL